MKKHKLINFKKNEDFQKDLQAGELMETSIIFVDDTKKIYTHGTEFDCSGGEADWNANEGEAGFIKNKPVVEVEELVYQNINLQFTENSTKINIGAILYLNDTSFLIEDKKYKVIIDNIEYDNIICSRRSGEPLLSNKGYNASPDFYLHKIENQVQFFVKDRKVNTSVALTIYLKDGSKQLDPKYLPLVQETGDSETSIMSQKAVTEALANVGGSNFNLINGEGETSVVMNTGNNSATGMRSVAIGQSNNSGGYASFTMGSGCQALKTYSFAEGNNTQSNGDYAHSEGFLTKAIGSASHSGGDNSISNGYASLAFGMYAMTNNYGETALGQYNSSSDSTTLFSVGNGNSGNRHNVIEAMLDGSIYVADVNSNLGRSGKLLKLQDCLFISWTGTQAEYDAITTKDSSTFYFIKED